MNPILLKIMAELDRAKAKHPDWPSDIIHICSFVAEEAGEAVQAANNHHYGHVSMADVMAELYQTAAVSVRALLMLETHRPKCWDAKRKSQMDRERWAKEHPLYCRACEGWGVDDPLDEESDYCLSCYDNGSLCPHCKAHLTEEHGNGKCDACGWRPAALGMPLDFNGCECWERRLPEENPNA